MRKFWRWAFLICVFCTLAGWGDRSARADVTMAFDDSSGDPLAGTFAPNTNITLLVKLTSTLESVSGVNYRLQVVEAAVSGKFKLTTRSLTNAIFGFNSANTDAAVVAGSAGLLDPITDLNLGAVVSDSGINIGQAGGPVAAGVGYLVATLTINIPTGTGPGVYHIQTVSDATDVGYDQGFFPFKEVPFDQQATYTVTVTPEPASAILFFGLAAMTLRRRAR